MEQNQRKLNMWKRTPPTFNYFLEKTKLSDVRQSTTKKILSSVFAIFFALLIAIIIACSICNTWAKCGDVFNTIFTAGFSNFASMNTLFSTMSIMLVAGLAFIVAFKAGLFNIGISGQMIFGATIAMLICHLAPLPPGANQIVILIVSVIASALLGGLIGFLKAYLNVNEVVSSIMFNWIIYFMSILLLASVCTTTSSGDYTADLDPSILFKMTIDGQAVSFVPLLIMSLLLVVIVAVVIKFTVFGKKQLVTGLSKTGALASGYNVKLNIIGSMALSGAIAGVLGVMLYCGFNPNMPVTAAAKAIPQEGFNGISVGLIAMCNPIAAVPVSLFFSMVQTSTDQLQVLGINNQIGSVIFGIVVYGAAAIALFLNLKPYWLTLKIFKGKKHSIIKHEQNMANLALLEITNDYTSLLKKYYQYQLRFSKANPSLKYSLLTRIKMFCANLQFKAKYWRYSKIMHMSDEQIKAIVVMSQLQNKRSGLAYRYDIANRNKMDRSALDQTKQAFGPLHLPIIRTKEQYRTALIAFYRAHQYVWIRINTVYDQYYKKYGSKKNKAPFDASYVKYDLDSIEKDYVDRLKLEIQKQLTRLDPDQFYGLPHEVKLIDKDVQLANPQQQNVMEQKPSMEKGA